jgi:hypothetical protein
MTLTELRDIGSEIEAVDWNEGGRVHNWRRYVPRELKQIWSELAVETLGAIYILAEREADKEYWE